MNGQSCEEYMCPECGWLHCPECQMRYKLDDRSTSGRKEVCFHCRLMREQDHE